MFLNEYAYYEFSAGNKFQKSWIKGVFTSMLYHLESILELTAQNKLFATFLLYMGLKCLVISEPALSYFHFINQQVLTEMILTIAFDIKILKMQHSWFFGAGGLFYFD